MGNEGFRRMGIPRGVGGGPPSVTSGWSNLMGEAQGLAWGCIETRGRHTKKYSVGDVHVGKEERAQRSQPLSAKREPMWAVRGFKRR